MLVDKITIKCQAGKGGDGSVRWRQEKFIDMGGPFGGNGGAGGDLYFKAVRDVYGLRRYDNNGTYTAENGTQGGTKRMDGPAGSKLILDIPVGSIVYNEEYDITTRFDIEGETKLMLRGGNGGYGNNHFKSSTNRSPYESTPGGKGEYATFRIEVEMIAKAGLIGFPNAGKSTLLNMLTRAQAKTANYAFTTLEPNLGDFYGYILADLPGLIEGAADGKGLGHKFLKHVRRTEILVHLVSAENDDVVASYDAIRAELEKFDKELMSKTEIVLLSKSDMTDQKDLDKKIKTLEKHTGKNVQAISLYEDGQLKTFAQDFLRVLDEHTQKDNSGNHGEDDVEIEEEE